MTKKRKSRRPKLMIMQRADLIHDRKAAAAPANLLAASVVVDDPYEKGGRIEVLRALRDDPLAGLHAAKQVDEPQYLAGRHLQRAYELAEIGGARAIDPTREAVDGGGIAQPTVSDAQAKAIGDIARAHRALGMEGESIVRDILMRHLSVAQTAAKRGTVSEREQNYIGRRFRECLDTLALVFGHAVVDLKGRRPDD